MKFSEKWLREWIDPPLTTDELAEKLTMAGLEVDNIEPAAGEFDSVVVGRIVGCEKHPNADKLRVCRVDVGRGELLQIVCGAPNARAGLKAPVALVGARLPGDFTIAASTLRGVESFGMLCSAVELGLGEDHSGLLELPLDAPVGEDLRRYLDLEDAVIDVDLTPNRADCFSLRGLAREVSAITGLDMHCPTVNSVPACCETVQSVTVQAEVDCPRYLSRVINGIDPSARSPVWLIEKLRRCGVRSIHPVVDVTNYVMLELGQPMHAFDRSRVQGSIIVRRAADGERMTLLDGKEVTLDPSFLLIADERGPLAIAGVMGGADSGVSDASRDIVLESAWFRPAAIMGKSRLLGIHTESGLRFERGVDPHLQRRAMERATELLLAIVGGTAGPILEVANEKFLPEAADIHLSRRRIGQVLGTQPEDRQVEKLLERLGMRTDRVDDGWQVQPPSARVDIQIAEDLIEELARLLGYDNLPSANLSGELSLTAVPETRLTDNRLRTALVDRGYLEAINYSFVSETLLRDCGLTQPVIHLANPLSEDMCVMRPMVFPGLLKNLAHNLRRQQMDVRLCELGTVFSPEAGCDSPYREVQHLAAVRSGPAGAGTWAFDKRSMDFFDMKGDLEALLSLNGRSWFFKPVNLPWLHPGRAAELYIDKQQAGWLGQIHPKVAKKLGIKKEAYAFEVTLSLLQESVLPRWQDVSRFPSVRRDLAIMVELGVSFDAVKKVIARSAGDVLKFVLLFDVYTGEGVESGCKSLAIGLILQEKNRTLLDKEVDKVVAEIVSSLKHEFGAEIRGSQ